MALNILAFQGSSRFAPRGGKIGLRRRMESARRGKTFAGLPPWGEEGGFFRAAWYRCLNWPAGARNSGVMALHLHPGRVAQTRKIQANPRLAAGRRAAGWLSGLAMTAALCLLALALLAGVLTGALLLFLALPLTSTAVLAVLVLGAIAAWRAKRR